MNREGWEKFQDAFRIEAEALTGMAGYIGRDAFDAALEALVNARCIAASGCGHSGIACMHFAHLMCCAGKSARFIAPSEAVHGASGFIHSGDVMVLASRGGKTAELIPILNICRTKGAFVISVTENLDSPLAKGADLTLGVKISREVDRDNEQGTTSFIVMNALFDALQAALIEALDFRKTDFALVHPGGAVGERLNNRTELFA
jgi:D-arabinose 5-phosphate isomerase GutQ